MGAANLNTNSNESSLSGKGHEIGQSHAYALPLIILIFIGLIVAVHCLTKTPTPTPPPLRPRPASYTEPSLGLSEDQLQRLPESVYRSQVEPRNCTICKEDLQQGTRYRCLPNCHHCYHIHCIDQWLVTRPTCPVCRGPAMPPTTSHEHEDEDVSGARREQQQQQQQQQVEENGHVSIDVLETFEEEALKKKTTTTALLMAKSLKRRSSYNIHARGEVELPSSSSSSP